MCVFSEIFYKTMNMLDNICKDIGLGGTHKLIVKKVGGRSIFCILSEDAEFIVKVNPHYIILIVG